MEADLACIDWDAPWLAPWRATGQRVAGRGEVRLYAALNAEHGGMRFSPAEELPQGVAYEQYIFDAARCPTRDNLHDFFNGLCWLAFPLAKKRLNQLQAGEIASAGVGGARGPVRDAITVFDENGALLDAPPALWDALRARDWCRLFVDLRPLWAQARLVVFGHALLEKLVRPRKELTAHVWATPAVGSSMAELDGWLAGQLTAGQLASKPFVPLPVLGIPGWWPENQNHSFYDDSLVFRPRFRGT